MRPTSTSPPRVRLQFGLRALLLAMLLVGVAITAYRWPWEETRRHSTNQFGYMGRQWWQSPDENGFDPHADYSAEIVTTYRRDWRGKPVKDGPRRMYFRGKLAEELQYHNGQLTGTLRSFDYAGRVSCETSFREGQLHGPFRLGDGSTWIETGEYFRGNEHGDWRTIESRQDGPPGRSHHRSLDGSDIPACPHGSEEMPADPIVCRSQWRHGKREGTWEWRTTDGEWLNTAEYADNRLVRWNGQLVNEPFRQWLGKVAANDPVLLAAMQLSCTSSYGVLNEGVVGWPNDFFVKDGGGEAWMLLSGQRGMPAGAATYRVLHYSKLRERTYRAHLYRHSYDELTIAEFLLEWAVREGLMFDFRYGELWLLPAGECSGEFRDATGVDKIRFDLGSSQAHDWEAEVVRSPYDVLFLHHTLRTLFRDTSIEFDFSDLEPVPQALDPIPDLLGGVQRTRREVLGLLLCRTGLQCEQQGNKLIIKRHWTGLESFRDIVNKNNSYSQ